MNGPRNSAVSALQFHPAFGRKTLATAKHVALVEPANTAMGRVAPFANVRASLTAKQFVAAIKNAAAINKHNAATARNELGISSGNRIRMPASAQMEPANATLRAAW